MLFVPQKALVRFLAVIPWSVSWRFPADTNPERPYWLYEGARPNSWISNVEKISDRGDGFAHLSPEAEHVQMGGHEASAILAIVEFYKFVTTECQGTNKGIHYAILSGGRIAKSYRFCLNRFVSEASLAIHGEWFKVCVPATRESTTWGVDMRVSMTNDPPIWQQHQQILCVGDQLPNLIFVGFERIWSRFATLF